MFISNKSILFLGCLIAVIILNGNANPVHKRHRTRSTTTTTTTEDDDDSITPEDDNDDSTTTTESDIDENDLTSIPSLISVSLPDIDDNDDVTIGPIVIDV